MTIFGMISLSQFAVCAGIYFLWNMWFWRDRRLTEGEKVFLTRGGEGGSQWRGAWGQAALRVGSRG